MAGYIVKRLLKAILSLFLVTAICFVLVYAFVPRSLPFKGDPLIPKLANQPDQLRDYKYSVWERLGYLDYVSQKDYAESRHPGQSREDIFAREAAMAPGSALADEFRRRYQDSGYTVESMPESGSLYAYRDVGLLRRLGGFYSRLVFIDHPWRIQDPGNPNLRRGYYLTRDWSGLPALAASGTRYKYQIWLDGKFPFVHQHLIGFYMGISYPSYEGQEVLDVIADGQGRGLKRPVTAMVGGRQRSFVTSIDEHSLRYKPILDHLDSNKFPDHYAEGKSLRETPSMLEVSFRLGMMALVLSLGFGVLFGVFAAMRQGQLFDRGLTAYVVLVFSLPILLYIALVSRFGMLFLGLPDKFPFYGAANPLSYALPILCLTLSGIAGEALWMRRYTVDQLNADYVKFARAKGLSNSQVFFRHVLRNAIIPIVHGLPMAVVGTLAGSILVESFFAVPGMGKMLVGAMDEYNNAMLIALVFIFTAVSILSLLVADILVTLVDPRISLRQRRGAR